MVKVTRRFNEVVYNELTQNIPRIIYPNREYYEERCKVCTTCQYLAKDLKCAKSNCKFYTEVLLNRFGKCPINKWNGI